jgi:hypothetical protein
MALDTRLIGQASGEGKPVDVASAIRPAFARAERAFAIARQEKKMEEREQRQREEQLARDQANLISRMGNLDYKNLDATLNGYATKELFKIKERALQDIQNKDLTPAERALAMQSYNGELAQLQSRLDGWSGWIQNTVTTQKDDLSKLTSPALYDKISQISNGQFQVNEFGQMVFEDGTMMSLEEMTRINPITRKSDAYLGTLKSLQKTAEQTGLKGASLEYFESSLSEELEALSLSDGDLASIVVDELGGQLTPELRAAIKDDFESDGDFDDDALREQLMGIIKTNYRQAAIDKFNIGAKEYNRIQSIPKPMSAAERKAAGEKAEAEQTRNDITNKFTREIINIYNLDLSKFQRNEEGIIIGGQGLFDNIPVQTESPEFLKLINRMGFALGDALGEGEDYRGTQIIKQGTNKAYEILEGDSLSNVLSRIIQAEGGTFGEGDVLGKRAVQTAENAVVIADANAPTPQTEEEKTEMARKKIAQYSTNAQQPPAATPSAVEVSAEEKRALPYRLSQKLIREGKPFTQENIDQAKKELNLQ